MFAPDQRTNVAELGIIDQRRFRDHLIATLIRAEDPNNDLGELYQYTRGIIDLEIWLRETRGCRQTVLERARPQRPRALAETETIGI
jgi:asparagine synthase (glutamine-hydrolysing)